MRKYLFLFLLCGCTIKEQEQKEPQYDRHHVRIPEKECIRRVNSIKLGENSLWVLPADIVVDEAGYLWLNPVAWAFPVKNVDQTVEIRAEVRGFSVKMKKMGLRNAEGNISSFVKSGYIPVVKIDWVK